MRDVCGQSVAEVHPVSQGVMDNNIQNRQLLTKLGLGALAFNSLLAMYRSGGDLGSVAFVLAADAGILLLFHFLRRLELAGQGDRGRLKAAVWILTTLLTALFASRVAPLMPPLVGVLVWAMSAATIGAGFWAFFLNA